MTGCASYINCFCGSLLFQGQARLFTIRSVTMHYAKGVGKVTWDEKMTSFYDEGSLKEDGQSVDAFIDIWYGCGVVVVEAGEGEDRRGS